jgi:ATP-dependent protease HslVU (ClpYQ) ATPase subunit
MQQRESAKKAAASAAVAAIATSGRADIGQPNPVAQTASWLDRAKSALQETPTENTVEAISLHYQMQEVQRLIHEGPVIQQTSADLPHMLDDETPAHDGQQNVEVEPADKRLRTDEDAEALVGFIRSVRASAASGEEF